MDRLYPIGLVWLLFSSVLCPQAWLTLRISGLAFLLRRKKNKVPMFPNKASFVYNQLAKKNFTKRVVNAEEIARTIPFGNQVGNLKLET